MPVRKIKKSYRNVTGAVVSRKNHRMISSESTLERDLYHLLEFDPLISNYEEQPIRVPYRMADGKMSHYTPDVLIHFENPANFVWKFSPFRRLYDQNFINSSSTKSYLIKPKSRIISPKIILAEVKYRKDLIEGWKDHKPKYKAARLFAKERGWNFLILTEKEIRTTILDNIKFIRRYRHYNFPPSELMKVLDKLAELESCKMNELLNSLTSECSVQGELIPIIWFLISRYEIDVDWNQPLTLNSRLSSNF